MGSKYNAARSDVEVLNSQLDHVREQLAAAQEQKIWRSSNKR